MKIYHTKHILSVDITDQPSITITTHGSFVRMQIGDSSLMLNSEQFRVLATAISKHKGECGCCSLR